MTSVQAWLLGHGAVLVKAKAKCEAAGLEAQSFEVLDASSRDFFSLLNACNQVAFGGLGMPAWVQLDCCTLPGLMVGWGGPAHLIEVSTREAVRSHEPRALDIGFWPYSEFCGVTRGQDELVGVSNFSLVPRQGLGLRAKALGLWLSGARAQIGMTQWSNAAVALHCKFGPLRVLRACTENHSRPNETFVYRVFVPSDEQLLELVKGEIRDTKKPLATHVEANDPQLGTTVQAWLDDGQDVEIVGWSKKELSLRLSNRSESSSMQSL